MTKPLPKKLVEYGMAMSVNYPEPEYPQDLIDSIVMPALRRSYDRARRDDWKLAKATTPQFEFMTGPIVTLYKHGDDYCGEHFDDNDNFIGCPGCDAGLPKTLDSYQHQFGWYVAVEMPEEDEEEDVANKPL
jgi:hypothetical protein